MIELLSPVGDFECLKAAVQNGADAVYFGANLFSARAFAQNFDDDNLKRVIQYAKLRGVKTHLTLNTLIKEDEFENAFNLAKMAYEYGIDAIIVQDLGLANILINTFPDLEIHGSTQMTIHNLEGVQQLEKIGFKRAVLSRELSIDQIEYICKNSNIAIEIFAHGALCVSYSGQCLFSSMIGGRSGNRGKCAQPCRLPYELIDNNEKVLDKGYILSTRDLCSLELLPNLIKAGVSSLKIEGRMKSPEYVATVTRIYRKYINLAEKYLSGDVSEYIIDPNDKKDLMQVFNRGGFSTGHLSGKPNTDLVFKEKPNNMGLYLGKIIKFNASKGLVTAKLENDIAIGDSISFEKEPSKYTISELMNKNTNIKTASVGQTVTFGRMKGNIHVNDKIYKISSKSLGESALNSYNREYIKNKIDCTIDIKKGQNIKVTAHCAPFNLDIDFVYNYIPLDAKNAPITREKVIDQFNKTVDTCFSFDKININLDDNIFMPVSVLNDIRRETISQIENKILDSFNRSSTFELPKNNFGVNNKPNPNISVLLNILSTEFDYNNLANINNVYIPLKYFSNDKYNNIISCLANKFNLYIYLPTILKNNYIETAKKIIQDATFKFNIYGVVISNISELSIIPSSKLDIIGNFTLNLYNSYTAKELYNLNINTVTISPELDKDAIMNLCNSTNINKELIVYGNIPVMTMNYCTLGKSNKCFDKCLHSCVNNNKYYLKDRMGFNFRILPDNSQTISTIYNSKTSSIEFSDFNINSVRIDILNENIFDINNIVSTVLQGNCLNGKDFTNGNLNRII